jgi:adenine-specific DNA-methyltransferase
MQKTGRLELTWVGKYDEPAVEPRILLEDKSKSYGDPRSENMLIHGDNLIALQALQQDYAGKIKCIFIDPPYNTGSAFQQYDDGLEHSIWLSMMRNRLILLRKLLSDDGSIWIAIDDNEVHYLKVMMDEIFSRKCFAGTVIWRSSDNSNNDAKQFSVDHNYILVYSKSEGWNTKKLDRNEQQQRHYSNPDNDPRGPWFDGNPISSPNPRPNLCYDIVAPNGNVIKPPRYGWRWSEETLKEKMASGEIRFNSNYTNIKRRTYLYEQKKLPPSSLWADLDETGHNRQAKYEQKKLFPNRKKEEWFATPKPEKLIMKVLKIATDEGDIVLDSFLGSATTAAVAHKMNRKWIGIELEQSAYTHCKPRLDMVIDGENGGISNDVDWQGGGGYHFYELAPSLLVKNEKLPIYQINPSYTFEMLCEAICKIEGFRYKPQDVFHGHSSEKRFIHISKEFINAGYIKSLAAQLAEGQSLLIYGTKIQSDMVLPDNIEVKKIPKDLLEKCDFESEVR